MTKPSVEFEYPTRARGKVPSFHSNEEEAVFWDTQDVTDFLDESSEVTVTFGREPGDRITLRLDRADRVALDRQARAKVIGPSTLIRMWVKERPRQEGSRSA